MKRILLLPGLGDVHWVLLKLRAWLERQGPEWREPELSIWNIDRRPRTLEYFKLVPGVRVGGYFEHDFTQVKNAFDSLYMRAGSKDAIFDFLGFDAFIGTNGNMRNAVAFDKILDGAPIDWSYGPVLRDDSYGLAQRARGPYVVLCFSGFGMFERAWCGRMSAPVVRELVAEMRARLPGRRFLFTGLAWDDAFARECLTPADEHLVGATSLEQFLSLLKHAEAYVGWCGGNAILAQHLGTPTVDWWSRRYFPKHDRAGWQTPGARRLVLEVEDYSSATTPAEIARFVGESPPRA